jgi:hypothetical protein
VPGVRKVPSQAGAEGLRTSESGVETVSVPHWSLGVSLGSSCHRR